VHLELNDIFIYIYSKLNQKKDNKNDIFIQKQIKKNNIKIIFCN